MSAQRWSVYIARQNTGRGMVAVDTNRSLIDSNIVQKANTCRSGILPLLFLHKSVLQIAWAGTPDTT